MLRLVNLLTNVVRKVFGMSNDPSKSGVLGFAIGSHLPVNDAAPTAASAHPIVDTDPDVALARLIRAATDSQSGDNLPIPTSSRAEIMAWVLSQ